MVSSMVDGVSTRGRGTSSWLGLPLTGLVLTGPIVGLVLTPVLFIVVGATGAGLGPMSQALWMSLSNSTMWNTVRLTGSVALFSALLGTSLAWCVECTDLPFRRLWTVLLIMPFAVPDFVVGTAIPNAVFSLGWKPLYDVVLGYWGAVIVMTLSLYPLVFLPVAASFRSADSGLEEAAQSLGLGRISTLFRVTVRQAWPAIVGGSVLVALVLVAEYDAIGSLGYHTFPAEVVSQLELNFSVATGCSMALILVGLGAIVLLLGEMAIGPFRLQRRICSNVRGSRTRHHLGRSLAPIVLGLALLVTLAIGAPIGTAVYWMVGQNGVVLPDASILKPIWQTILNSSASAILATLMALPVATVVSRARGALARLMERCPFIVLALPGSLAGLAYIRFAFRFLGGLGYQSPQILVLAYAVLFFPFALVGICSALPFAPESLQETAEVLGSSRIRAFFRVTLRLISPGLAAGFALVFIACTTEITTTLMLAPPGMQTLSTQFWAYHQDLSYSRMAPYALAMVALAALPALVLGRCYSAPIRRSRSSQ